MSRRGFKVSSFTDALVALEHFKANHKNCGLILSVIRMPGMNGYEFVMHVKKINSKVKVILMAAFEIQDKEFHNIHGDNIHGGINISKYEKEGSLMIADALEEYLGHHPLIYLKKGLANYAKMEKNGLSVLADLGAYPHKSKYKDLVNYELSLPTKYDVPMKGFCLYHQKDFDTFSDEQKQKLIEHHGKAMRIMQMQ